MLLAKTKQAFTLIETMVVLLIIAIVTTVAVMVFDRADTGRAVDQLAKQMQVVFKMAGQEAILRPCVLRMQFTAKGFQFFELTRDVRTNKFKWIKLRNDKLSQPDFFPSNLVVTLTVSHAIFANKNSVVFYPNGNVSPFELSISGQDQKHIKTLSVNAVGAINEK